MKRGSMKITSARLKELVQEEMNALAEAKTEADQSHQDLAVQVSRAASALDNVMIEYVDSGWLDAQDQASLAKNLEDAYALVDKLRTTFSTLASSEPGM